MSLLQPQKLFLQSLLLKKVAPLLEDWWAKVFENRSSGEVPTEKISPVLDCFKLVAVPFDKEGKKGELHHLCMVSKPRPFWDVTLAFYSLFFPLLFPQVSEVAQELLNFFHEYKVDPSGMDNFDIDHWNYLEDTAKGLRENKFLTHPIETLVALDLILWTWTQDPEFPVELREKRMEEKIEELKETEEEWEKAKKENYSVEEHHFWTQDSE